MRSEFEIEGMSCQHCVRAVRTTLEKLEGVQVVEVRVGHVSLEAPRALRRDELDAALADEGYRVKG